MEDNHYREQLLQYSAVYKKDNKEKIKVYGKKRYVDKKEYYNDYSKEYYVNNDFKFLQYRLKNRDYFTNYQKKWLNTDKEKMLSNLRHIERKNKEKNLLHSFNPEEWQEKVRLTRGICPGCLREFISCDTKRCLTMDHHPAIKVAREGYNYSIDDMTPLCKSCNSSKNKYGAKVNFKNFLDNMLGAQNAA